MALTTRAKVLQYLGLADDATSDPAIVASVVSGTSATFTLTGNTLTVTPDPGSPSSFDLTAAAYDTITELASALDGLAYLAANVAAADGSLASSLIVDAEMGVAVSSGDNQTIFYTNESAGTSSALIDQLISDVGSMAEDYCGRVFDQASVDERVDGNGAHSVVLRSPPVESLTLSRFDGNTETTYAATDYYLDEDAGVVHLLDSSSGFRAGTDEHTEQTRDAPRPVRRKSPRFPDGVRNVRAQYTGGFATIPGSLELAATQMVAALFLDRFNNPMLTSDQMQGRTKQRAAGPAAVRQMVAEYFRPWRRPEAML
jgi:hypothetical protein